MWATTGIVAMTQKKTKNGTTEGFNGLGRARRQEMIRRWKKEGQPRGLSLKAWAREALVGDAALAWLETKKTVHP